MIPSVPSVGVFPFYSCCHLLPAVTPLDISKDETRASSRVKAMQNLNILIFDF
jgi:hypothetical protein